jgi:acyl-coenzyme A synthetase/AMP-(fatty) acid ligase
VVFGDLPRTATGKVQKFKLRQRCATEPTSEEGEA